MSDFNTVAKSFVEFYYQTFDTNRPGLLPLYRESSMLTFEGQQFQGANDITQKLVELPFQKVAHKILTIDAQPSTASGSIIVIVSGQLLIDEEQNPQFFTQSFVLIPENNSFYVFNDMFRLIYGA